MNRYHSDFAFAWSLRLVFLVSFAIFMAALAGCSTRGVQGTVNGTVSDPSISVGKSTNAGTWSPLPQGGTDEKSNSAPSESSK